MDLSKYNIDKFIEDTDSMTMNNIRFDELDVNSLIVNEENLLDALSKQAAAVAYFGGRNIYCAYSILVCGNRCRYYNGRHGSAFS